MSRLGSRRGTRPARTGAAMVAVAIAVAIASPGKVAAEARCRTYMLVVEDTARRLVDRSAIDAALASTTDLARARTPDADLTVRIRAKAWATVTKSATGRLNDMFEGHASVAADWTSSGPRQRWQELVSDFESRSTGDRFVNRDVAEGNAQGMWRRLKRQAFTAAVVAALRDVARDGCPRTDPRQDVVLPVPLPPAQPPAPKTASVEAPVPSDGSSIRSLVLGLGGVVLLVTILILVMRLRRKLDRFQQLVFLVLLALASAAAVSILAGQIDVTTDTKLGWGVRATGGLAVFALVLSLGYRFLGGETGKAKSDDDGSDPADGGS